MKKVKKLYDGYINKTLLYNSISFNKQVYTALSVRLDMVINLLIIDKSIKSLT